MANEKRTLGQDLGGMMDRVEKKIAFMASPEQRELRAEIIKRAYESSKCDYVLKTKVYIYYMKHVKPQAISVDAAMGHFKEETEEMFRSKKLKPLATDEQTKEGVDEKVVLSNIRRMMRSAADRYDTMRGNDKKGPDDKKADPLAPIRTTLTQNSIENIADAFFQIGKEKRMVDLLRAMYSKLTHDSQVALLFDLEQIVEREGDDE